MNDGRRWGYLLLSIAVGLFAIWALRNRPETGSQAATTPVVQATPLASATGATATPTATAEVEPVGTAGPKNTIPPLLQRLRLGAEAYAVMGEPDAPLTIVEFSDFQCPWCGRFAREVMPKLEETYIRTGRVYFVYKDFAALGPESEPAAQAAECAGQQGKYWEMQARLFADAPPWAHRGVGRAVEVFKQYAQDLALDAQAFATCLMAEDVLAEIREDFNEARALGARGTPTFLVGNQFVPGFLLWERFQQVVEEALVDAEPAPEGEHTPASVEEQG